MWGRGTGFARTLKEISMPIRVGMGSASPVSGSASPSDEELLSSFDIWASMLATENSCSGAALGMKVVPQTSLGMIARGPASQLAGYGR